MRCRFLVAIVAVTAVTLSGCGLFGDDGPQDSAEGFLTALADGHTDEAAGYTDNADQARALISSTWEALAPTSVSLDLRDTTEDGGRARSTFTAAWDLGQGRIWSYEGSFDLEKSGDDWQVRWAPSVLHPDIGAQQRLELRVEQPDPAPVVDRDGTPLLTPQFVVIVALDPAQAPTAAKPLADTLNRFDPDITEQSILDGVRAVPQGSTYPVAVLRDADYRSVKDLIYELPGVTFPTERRLLGPAPDYGTQVLPGIRSVIEDRLAGDAGWRVVTIDTVGAQAAVLTETPPRPVPTIRTTLRGAVQSAAEDAIAAEPKPAVIVAMSASDGGILAVAQNDPADKEGAIALTGRYPPGSTFKTVTAAAALKDGLTIDSPVECPGTTVIGNRLIPNNNRFELGRVPLRQAFAHSCNTTFATLAAGFGPAELTTAASQLGIGADFDIPGITTITGSVAPSEDQVLRAENGFGQGQVLASPFGMALAAATVANGGRVPTPSLIDGQQTNVGTAPGEALPAVVATSLQTMMREVVTGGSAGTLADLPGQVGGKTGTAEYRPGASHGWFIGYRGDLAFAVLLVDSGSSGPAVDAADRFLKAVGP